MEDEGGGEKGPVEGAKDDPALGEVFHSRGKRREAKRPLCRRHQLLGWRHRCQHLPNNLLHLTRTAKEGCEEGRRNGTGRKGDMGELRAEGGEWWGDRQGGLLGTGDGGRCGSRGLRERQRRE